MAAGRHLVSFGLTAASVVAGGTAWAIAEAGESRSTKLSRPTGVLVQGTLPNGGNYEVSSTDPAERGLAPTEASCLQISTSAATSQGCNLVPDAQGRVGGQPWRPSLSVLGASRFFTTLAPEGVMAMEVQVDGEPKPTTSRSIDAGSAGKLLLVALDGRVVTSRDPESSLDYQVRLIDSNGDTVHQISMSDSGG